MARPRVAEDINDVVGAVVVVRSVVVRPSRESVCHSWELSLYLVAMERTDAALLSIGPPAEGTPPVPTERSLPKQPHPPLETEQVSATQVAPHGPWLRLHHTQQAQLLPAPHG
eukprot:scaffold266423_cov33-Tisochrysis_lutea.AAC.4